MAAGMDDYIAKPTALMELSEKLNRWLPAPIRQPSADPAEQQPLAAGGGSGATLAGPEAGGGMGKVEPRPSLRTLAHFRQVNGVDVIHLLQAVEQGDMQAVAHCAHRIKGACGFIGATALATVCGMIEHAGRQDDAPGVSMAHGCLSLGTGAIECSHRRLTTIVQRTRSPRSSARTCGSSCVEDHEFQRTMIVEMLESLGVCSIHEAGDGFSALELTREHEPAL